MDIYLWLAGTAAFLVGLSKGGLPAVGMLAVPVLSMVMSPVKAAVLLLPVFVISDFMGLWLYRREYSAVNLRILIPAALGGVLLGWATASMVSDRAITGMIGAMGVGFCLNTWLRRNSDVPARPPSRTRGSFWGVLVGFTSFISHSGAPPFQIYMLPQRLPQTVFAGTSTLLFAAVNAAKIIPYQALRPYSLQSLGDAAVLVPFALAGALAGAWLVRRISTGLFYRIVQASLFAVSLKLLADALRG
jgi:uncharacterized protein